MNARLHTASLAINTVPASFHKPHKDPASLTIDHQGVICDCNETAMSLFGFLRDELVTRHISALFPQLVDVEWVQKGQPNPHLSYLSHIGHRFCAVTRDGREFASKLFLNDLSNSKLTRLLLVIRTLESV
jgi:PAS domain S-box-containing protein